MKLSTKKMNFLKKPIQLFAELMTNKYFLWFMAALSSFNIIGYMSMGYVDAVVLFALTAFITFVFSKNMTVVLLVSVIIVNLYMQASSYSMEGLTASGRTDGDGLQDLGEKQFTTNGRKEKLTNKEDVGDDEVEMTAPTNTTTTTTTISEDGDDEDEAEYEDEDAFRDLEPAKVKQHPHIDYGTTLTDAYKNLEKMLGEGGLQNLTTDTKKLMEQQSKLFNSMENITPLLAQAQSLMKNMDMNQLTGKVGNNALADSAEHIGKSSK
jgi:hypothetical protein